VPFKNNIANPIFSGHPHAFQQSVMIRHVMETRSYGLHHHWGIIVSTNEVEPQGYHIVEFFHRAMTHFMRDHLAIIIKGISQVSYIQIPVEISGLVVFFCYSAFRQAG
jgi:hypothetical protein